MRRITSLATLLAILIGTGAMCRSLMVPFVGLLLGPLFLSPLFVTLVLSRKICGAYAQSLLLLSTVLYAAVYFSWLSYFHGSVAPAWSLPAMIVLWGAAVLLRAKKKALNQTLQPTAPSGRGSLERGA
jgi:hypothetical protein